MWKRKQGLKQNMDESQINPWMKLFLNGFFQNGSSGLPMRETDIHAASERLSKLLDIRVYFL